MSNQTISEVVKGEIARKAALDFCNKHTICEVLTELEAVIQSAIYVATRKQRDGKWIDEMWACKVCDGEIPYGHTPDCDIYKLLKRIRELEAARVEETDKTLTKLRAAWIRTAERSPTKEDADVWGNVFVADDEHGREGVDVTSLENTTTDQWPYWMPIPPVPGAAAARVEPTDKWTIVKRESTDDYQCHVAIMEGDKEIVRLCFTRSPVNNEMNTQHKAERICTAHNASLPATPTPQGQK